MCREIRRSEVMELVVPYHSLVEKTGDLFHVLPSSCGIGPHPSSSHSARKSRGIFLVLGGTLEDKTELLHLGPTISIIRNTTELIAEIGVEGGVIRVLGGEA